MLHSLTQCQMNLTLTLTLQDLLPRATENSSVKETEYCFLCGLQPTQISINKIIIYSLVSEPSAHLHSHTVKEAGHSSWEEEKIISLAMLTLQTGAQHTS